MSRNYNNYKNVAYNYGKAMNKLNSYEDVLNSYDYGLPDENDPEVQRILKQAASNAALDVAAFPRAPIKPVAQYRAPAPQYRAPAPQYRAPAPQSDYQKFTSAAKNLGAKNQLSEKEYNKIMNTNYNTYSSISDADLDYGLSYLDDELAKPIDLSKIEFRIPRRRISRSSKSQYAKRRTSKSASKRRISKTSRVVKSQYAKKTTKKRTSKRTTKKTSSKRTSKKTSSKRNTKN
jgi:hypothetical protein